MTWWTAHKEPGAGADDVVFVREGFSWWALFFPLLWLAAKGMWIILLVALGAQLAIWALADALGFGQFMSVVFSCAINLIIAFEGNDLLRWTYGHRDFTTLGLVHGDDLDEAEYRFFTEIGMPAESEVEKVGTLKPPLLSSRWKSDLPDVIFPGFGRS